ncbi:MAG: hypothetical protein AB7G11_07960 [Phycisphaerales bacterium]
MSETGASAKICQLCGTDCSAIPRLKDGKGGYFCKPCAEKAAAKRASSAPKSPAPASKVAAAPSDQGIMAKLVDDSLAGASGACPACRRKLKPGALVCTTCGFNTSTGQMVQTSVLEPEKNRQTSAAAAKAGKVAVAGMSPVFALIGACIGGAVGGGIWFAIGYFAHLEIGYIAVLVGALCGVGASIGANKYAGVISGAIAAAVSIGSILAAKWMIVEYVLNDLGGTAKTGVSVEDGFFATFTLIDIVFFVIAIAAAWGAGSKNFASLRD